MTNFPHVRIKVQVDHKVHQYIESNTYYLSIPSIRLSNLQSSCDYFVAIITWSYTKFTGISFPSGPCGPTWAIWFGSSLVKCVFTMAQASRAPSRQADVFHSSNRCRAPLNRFTKPSILSGGVSAGHNALTILLMAFRARACTTDSSFSTSPWNPDTSSSGRPVNRPATTESWRFELWTKHEPLGWFF